jgi:N6-L-threonylcarbamoyladenine synthase
MLILGIDTSCDDTAAAVVRDGKEVVSNIVSSQNEIHARYGGIVPELASRRHIEMIVPVIDEALSTASIDFDDVDAVAVTHGPGLIGSLIVGVCFAKSISFMQNKPLVAVNHLEGHICAVFLESTPQFPFVALIASGGHTSLYRVDGFGQYSELGRTRDDAAGEAYDKVAKLLGLGYPGGPEIERAARKGDAAAIFFPRADLGKSFDFSFSGLKTAVSSYLKKNKNPNKFDVAASFQSAVIDVLVGNAIAAAEKEGVRRIVLSGGVTANSALREAFSAAAAERGYELFIPSFSLCTDNAAMIAAAGHYRFVRGETSGLNLNPTAFMPLEVQLR